LSCSRKKTMSSSRLLTNVSITKAFLKNSYTSSNGWLPEVLNQACIILTLIIHEDFVHECDGF
jgi:hypothetical protein